MFRLCGPRVGPLLGSLALGAQQAKLDADIHILSSLGTPLIPYVHDYHYSFPIESGGRLAPMAAELVYRLAILVVVRRFPSLHAADSRSLRSESYTRMKEADAGPHVLP
jgi:hypothetical protein